MWSASLCSSFLEGPLPAYWRGSVLSKRKFSATTRNRFWKASSICTEITSFIGWCQSRCFTDFFLLNNFGAITFSYIERTVRQTLKKGYIDKNMAVISLETGVGYQVLTLLFTTFLLRSTDLGVVVPMN